jgi:two-component system cell cycle sensor histidine kinase/response regulator CckA
VSIGAGPAGDGAPGSARQASLAANADEAVSIFDEHPSIDVLLTDVASGPELTRRLVERRPGMKIVNMPGYNEEAIGRHDVVEADIAFLRKPFTSDSLERKLRTVLDR